MVTVEKLLLPLVDAKEASLDEQRGNSDELPLGAEASEQRGVRGIASCIGLCWLRSWMQVSRLADSCASAADAAGLSAARRDATMLATRIIASVSSRWSGFDVSSTAVYQ